MNIHYVLNSGERDVVQATIKMIPAHKKLTIRWCIQVKRQLRNYMVGSMMGKARACHSRATEHRPGESAELLGIGEHEG